MRSSLQSRYYNSINMSYSELLKWSKTPCSHKASLDRKPIERNLRLLKKKKWNKFDEAEAKKTISFIARMKKVKSGKNVSKDCPYSRRDISLLNWAYDPMK